MGRGTWNAIVDSPSAKLSEPWLIAGSLHPFWCPCCNENVVGNVICIYDYQRNDLVCVLALTLQ